MHVSSHHGSRRRRSSYYRRRLRPYRVMVTLARIVVVAITASALAVSLAWAVGQFLNFF